MSVQAVWRIALDAPFFKADDLSGEGAKKSGGRWNKKGTPVLYTSESIALACLETLVHINAQGLPLTRYLVRIDIPTKVWNLAKRLNAKTAGMGWDALPAGAASIEKGQKVCTIVDINQVWFIDNKFGVSIRLHQCLLELQLHLLHLESLSHQ